MFEGIFEGEIMAPNRFKNSDFIRRIVAASEDLDTLVMLSKESYTEAYNTWVRDFAKALNTVERIYKEIEYSATANVSSLEEKILEKNNYTFLQAVAKYVSAIDLIIARKSLQFAKIAEKYLTQKAPHLVTDQENEKKIKLAIEASEYLNELETALNKINRYSLKLKKDFESRNLKKLANYKYHYERLDLFSRLTVDDIITRLRTAGEI
jgi:hypothetical protein